MVIFLKSGLAGIVFFFINWLGALEIGGVIYYLKYNDYFIYFGFYCLGSLSFPFYVFIKVVRNPSSSAASLYISDVLG